MATLSPTVPSGHIEAPADLLDHVSRVQAQPSAIAQTVGILVDLNAYLLLMAEEMFDKDLSKKIRLIARE
jgi:hypothetical protein